MVANTAAPDLGEDLPAAWPSQETLAFLARRRSTTARLLAGPGPDAEALSLMLRIAARAPDHRRVTPFRFIVYEGAARTRAGEALAAAFRTMEPGAADDRVAQERARFERAPVVVAVVSKVDPNHKTPEWEQILTAGAVCQNLLLAALASGFAAQWLTEWYAYDEAAKKGLGVGADERVAGYLYIGAATENPKERARPDVDALVTAY